MKRLTINRSTHLNGSTKLIGDVLVFRFKSLRLSIELSPEQRIALMRARLQEAEREQQ